MGLIRKSLAVGTFGVVRGSSKKQRVARDTLKEAQEQTRLMKADAAGDAALARVRELNAAAAEGREPTPPPWSAGILARLEFDNAQRGRR